MHNTLRQRVDAAMQMCSLPGLCLVLTLALIPSSAKANSTVPVLQTATSAGWAELTEEHFNNLGKAEGIPDSKINCMAQDGDGFIWIGTQNGLARWDGYHIKLYHAQEAAAHGLGDDLIHALHTDKSGRLWIGNLAGLFYYDRSHDDFVQVPVPFSGRDARSVTYIVSNDSGHLWAGTEDGLLSVETSSMHAERIRSIPGDNTTLPDNHVTSLLLDREQRLWVGTQRGLARFETSDTHKYRFQFIPIPEATKSGVAINALAQTNDGNIWIGTVSNGLHVLAAHADVRELDATLAVDHKNLLTQEQISSLVEVAPGRLWIGSGEHGLFELDTASQHLRNIRHTAGSQNSLVNDVVATMLKDKFGSIWIGTHHGISRHSVHEAGILTISGMADNAHSLSDQDVTAVTVTSRRSLWLGYVRNGIDIIDQAHQHIHTIAEHDAGKSPLKHVSSIVEAPDASIYVATVNVIKRFDQDGKFLSEVSLNTNSTAKRILTMYLTESSLWISVDYDGLWRLRLDDHEHPRAEHILHPEQLSNGSITSIQPANHGQLWLGTVDGLNLFNPKTLTLAPLTADHAVNARLEHGPITSMLSDSRGRLWIATRSGLRILSLSDQGPSISEIGAEQGLPNPIADKITETSDGGIWVSTDSGLAQIDPNSLKVRNRLDHSDGLTVENYITNSGAALDDGDVVFGGLGGITIIQPKLIEQLRAPVPIAITEIALDGKVLTDPMFGEHAKDATPVLQIPPQARSFTVEFAALDYAAPELNRYSYYLENYDDSWIDTDARRRSVSYTNLSPGNYRMHVRGTNHKGVYSGEELILPIRVLPAWYQTWFAYVGLALGLLTLVLGLIQLRTRVLRRRQAQLELLVAERTDELRTRNRQLAAAYEVQEEQQSELTRFLAVASHDLRQPMHALNLYLDTLQGTRLPETAQSVLNKVRQCANIMDEMFLALLDLSRLDAQIITPNISRFPIAQVLEQVRIEFAPQAREKGLQLHVIHSSAWVESDPALVARILNNFTANAIRYTNYGKVLVGCRRRGDQLRLAVLDTGIGIPRAQQHSVFEEFCQIGPNARDRSKGLGLGLAIVRRLSRLLTLPITLESEPGRGSMFAIDIPICHEHSDRSAMRSHRKQESYYHPLAANTNILRGNVIAVVDDEDSILHATRLLLESKGCKVVTARSSTEALSNLHALGRRPDALICDYRLLTKETGLEVAQRIHEEYNLSVPTIIITGTVSAESIAEIAASGWPLLHKPVNGARLLEILEQVMTTEAFTN